LLRKSKDQSKKIKENPISGCLLEWMNGCMTEWNFYIHHSLFDVHYSKHNENCSGAGKRSRLRFSSIAIAGFVILYFYQCNNVLDYSSKPHPVSLSLVRRGNSKGAGVR